MYDISSEPSQHRVVMTFNQGEARASATLTEELGEVIQASKRGDGSFDMLVLLEGTSVWTPSLADKAESLMDWFVSMGMRRSATVYNSEIQQKQMMRLSKGRDKFQVFSKRHEAESWLSS